MKKILPCPNCGSRDLRGTTVDAAAPGCDLNLLPGVARFLSPGSFLVVVCCECGLTRLFASPDSVEKLSKSVLWERTAPSGQA